MPRILCDIHAHLDLLDDIDTVINTCKSAGVYHIIATGVDVPTSQYAVSLAQRYAQLVLAAGGLYPNQAESYHSNPDLLDTICGLPNLVAISECGLDYTDVTHKDLQKKLFIAQILRANHLAIPLIVHSRKAESDVLALTKQYANVPVILHCFEANKALIAQAVQAGYYLTATCNIKRSDSVKQRVSMTPLSQLLTETDSPFMAPNKGQINTPDQIVHAVSGIASIKGITEQECSNIIYMNFKKLFF